MDKRPEGNTDVFHNSQWFPFSLTETQRLSVLAQRDRTDRKIISGVLAVASWSVVYMDIPAIQSFLSHTQKTQWLFLMFCVGIIHALGIRFRTMRHIGFVLGCFEWTALAINSGLTATALVCALLGATSFIAYLGEARYSNNKV